MERALTLLVGRASSGKSAYLFERLRQHAERGERAILLTEEQSTYEAEKALCNLYGGLLGTEVLSIARFAERILEENGETPVYLSPQGRCMVMKKLAAKCKKELKLFARAADRRGFAAEADRIIDRLSRSAVSPEALASAAKKLPAGVLPDKLSDIALLYGENEKYLADKYLTGFSLLERAEAALPDSLLARSHIYVDSADLSGGQAFRFLGALLQRCLSMTVTVLADPENAEEPLFSPGAALTKRLFTLAADTGLSCRVLPFREHSTGTDTALVHLEKYLYREKTVPFAGIPRSIHFFTCPGRTEEVELLCEKIADLTQEGVCYRDISVTVTDREGYLPLIRRAFRRRGIPLFEDSTRLLSSHAAADLLLSGVRFAARGSMEDVLHVIKSGLTPVTQEEGEAFENYVLRRGFFGSRVFTPFTETDTPEAAESARAKLCGPLSLLKEGLSKSDGTAKGRVEAVYSFLTGLHVPERLRIQTEELLAAGETGEAQLVSEIWAGLVEVLSQIADILGTDPLPLKDLPGLLEEGIFSVELSPLPGTQDRVTVGDLDRSRCPQRDVLFLLGANEGLLPPKRTDDGLFSDKELAVMEKEAGLTLWDTTEQEMAKDRLFVYTVLTKARTRLFLSAAAQDGGKDLAPASLKNRLLSLFPLLRQEQLSAAPPPTYPDGAFEQTLRELTLFEQEGKYTDGLSEKITYFSRTEPYAADLEQIRLFRSMTGRTLSLGRRLAGELYGRVRGVSASRLETYGECPFRHYMQYGLRLKSRPEFTEQAADAGELLHDVLKAFTDRAALLDPSFASLTDRDADRLIDEIMAEQIKTHNEGIYGQDPLLQATLFLQVEAAKKCAHAILAQIQSGDFLPEKTEYAFGGESGTPALPIPMQDGDAMLLYGRIDRVDKSESGHFIRIIDYKLTQSPKLSPGKVLEGVLLQLPLYLLAVRGEDGRIAGMYYMPMSAGTDPKTGQPLPLLLNGITNSSDEAVLHTERDFSEKSRLIASLSRKKGGEWSASAPVCDGEALSLITQCALSAAADAGRQIREGRIGVLPYDKNTCTYCDYGSVCRFDREHCRGGYRERYGRLKLKDFIARLKGENDGR